MPRIQGTKSSVLDRLIDSAFVIGLTTALVYTFVFKFYQIFSHDLSLPLQNINFAYFVWGGFRLADLILFSSAVVVIPIYILLILREEYEYPDNRCWFFNSFVIMFIVMFAAMVILLISEIKRTLSSNNSESDYIFPIIVGISLTLMFIVLISGFKPGIRDWIIEWQQLIKAFGLFAILLFIHFYPGILADESAKRLMNDTNYVTLIPNDSNTKIIPDVLNNEFSLILYEDNTFYARERNNSSMIFVIPESQVKYVKIKINSDMIDPSILNRTRHWYSSIFY